MLVIPWFLDNPNIMDIVVIYVPRVILSGAVALYCLANIVKMLKEDF